MKNYILKKIVILLYRALKSIEERGKNIEIGNLQFKSVGANISLGKDYSIYGCRYIEIGDNFKTLDRFRIEAFGQYYQQRFNPVLKIGNNVIFNTDIHIGCINKVQIGNNCLFASRIFISDHDHGDTSMEMVQLNPSRIFLVTTLLAAIIAFLPIVTPERIATPSPIQQSSPIITGPLLTRNLLLGFN